MASLKANIAIHGSSNAVAAIALFLVHAVAGRYLGVEDYGLFSFGIAFAAMFVPAFDPGIGELMVRELARDRTSASHYIAQAYVYKVVALIPLLLVATVILWIVLESPIAIIVSLAMFVAMWLNSLKGALRPVFVAYERFDLNARIVLFERIGLLLLVGAVSLTYAGLVGVIAAFIVWRVVDLAYTTRLCNKMLVKVTYAGHVASLWPLVMQALPIGAFYLTSGVYNYLDTVMIGAMRHPEEVGLYSAAYRLYEGFFLAASVVSSVFMPRLSRAYAQKLPSLMALAAKGGGLLVILGIVCTAGIWLFAAPVIELFYGQDFDASSQTLRILSYGLPLAFVAYFLQTLLISTDKPTRAFIVALIGLLFNGALNFYLIPRYGQEGAAWATVISIVFVVICLLVVVVAGAGEYRKQVDKRVEPSSL